MNKLWVQSTLDNTYHLVDVYKVNGEIKGYRNESWACHADNPNIRVLSKDEIIKARLKGLL
jgi:hypothetical protein